MSESHSTPTQLLKLVGENVKVVVRSAPNSEGRVLRHISPGEIVEVKVTNSKGFYRLADGSVRVYLLSISFIFVLTV